MAYNRPEQRVVVLIDTQNMYHSAKHLYGARLNFGALVEQIVGERALVRAIAYVATSKTGEEKGFFGALVASGIDIRSKDVIEFASGERKADWDVGMAIDAVRLCDRVDCVVLVTGDGDFVPLVEYLQNKGVVVEVAAFSESTSKTLRERTDVYFDISAHQDLLMVAGGRRAHAGYAPASHAEPEDDFSLEVKKEDERFLKKSAPRSSHAPSSSPRRGASGSRRVRITT